MTGKQNNSIVKIKPNELVQHKNKFKSIAIYKEEQYESTVELINENYKEQALTLSTSPDGNDANKLYVTAKLAKDPKGVVSYEWKVLGVDGITNLIDEKNVNFSVDNDELTIKNQWDIKKFITIQAFAYSNGIYIASSDILTVYEKDANLISAITVDFSKDHVVIPEGITDSANIQDLTTTTVTVYRGEDNITSACKYIWSTKDGSVTNLINSNQESVGGNVNGIKEFTNDTDELKVIIEVPKITTLEGSITLEKIMPISRGGNAIYSIIPSIGVINITKLNIEQDYTFTMQRLTSATGATTLTELPSGHSLAWQYINKNGIAIENKRSIGSPTSGVWTFKYNPNFEGAAGFSIILSDAQGDIVDSEQITFIQNGMDYTGLILAASSQVFSTSDPDTATITLTAQLYGDLVGETVSWYFGDSTTPDVNGKNPYVLEIDQLSGKTSLKVRAEAGNGKYSDTITIYKLNDAITAFFTNELMTFNADALGMVGSQNSPVAFTSNVKVFQGTTDVTNKITNISLTSTNSLSNVVITPAYPTESDPKIVPSVTISAKGTNFGTREITSGKFSFTVTVDGIGNIPLDLSWIKIPAPNGINNIEEYYQATATNESPNPYSDVDKKIIDTKWKTTIIDADQTKEKPYLWNFERIRKDNGDILRDTDVSLLSSSPRTIVSTTEYYTTNTTGVIPAGATYNDTDTEQTGNDAPKIDAAVWKTVEPTLAQGEYLYNFEVVQYAAVDADNKNLYTWTEPVQMGYAGKDGDKGATPYIGEDDYWYINGVSLGIKAKGEDGADGTTPTVSINNDGYWVINGTPTNVSAQATNYTNLLITATSQTFVKNPNNGNSITPSSVTLTPNLYGDLKDKDVTWYQGTTPITADTATSANIYRSGKQLVVKSEAFGNNTSLTFTAKAKVKDTDTEWYDDDYTLYLLTDGTNGTPGGKGDTGDPAYSAYLTDQSWSFSADKDGSVSAGVTKTTTVKIFKGITEITTGVGIAQVAGSLNNVNYGDFAYSNTSPTLTFTSKNSNLGSNNSQDGQITITATADNKTFTLGLSWDKTNTGPQGPDGEFVYLLPSTTSITKTGSVYSPSSITLDMIKKSGDNAPVSIGITGFKYSLSVDGVAKVVKQNLLSSLNITGLNANQSIVITIYDSNDKRIDVKTINISPEALAEYVLYSNYTTGDPPTPNGSYANYKDKDNTATWVKVQASDSVWQSKKSAYPSLEANTSWGAPVRISGVLTNFTDLYNTLQEQADNNYDGLYKWKDTIDGKTYQRIGVDASVIRAGAIKIGDAENAKDNKFYADTNPSGDVYIAGWKVNSGSLTNFDEKVSLTPNGTSATINQTAIDGVVINANKKFAVTKDGKVYATAGKIGNVSIDNIASTKINPNLFIGSTNDNYWTSSTGTLGGTNGEYWITWDGTTGGGAERFIYHQPFGVTIGKTYTLSFDAKKTDNLSSSEIFILQNDWKGSNYVLNWTGFSSQLTQEYKRFSHTFTVPDYEGNMADCDLRFDHNGSTNGKDATLWVRNIKLEEGTEATAWSLAPEDIATTAQLNVLNESISAKVENSYTGTSIDWAMKDDKFTVTAKAEGKTGGITVDKDGLVVEGNIKAHGGEIGGWNIGENSLTSGTAGENGSFHMATSDFNASIAERNATDWRLTIGENFGVNSQGHFYANAGKIGKLTIGKLEAIPEQVAQDIAAASSAKEEANAAAGVANQFANDANAAKNVANTAANSAQDARNQASDFKDQASEAAGAATNARNQASNFKDQARGAADEAGTARDEASDYKDQAKNSADSAADSSDLASRYAAGAESAKGYAILAQQAAEIAAAQAKMDFDALDKKLIENLTGGNTALGDDYVISPYIGGGYLKITNAQNTVLIDPAGVQKDENQDNYPIFQVISNGTTAATIDTQGNATFTGTIYATGGDIGGVAIGDIASTDAVGKAKNEAIDEVKKLGYQTRSEVTQITKDTVSTATIIAKNLTAGYIQSDNYDPGVGTESALVFTPVGDHYKVGLKATGIPSEVLIPEIYNGKLVTELDVESFASGKKIIKKLAIPASITTHPFGLLKDYTEIEELHAPIHIESITDPVKNRTYQPYFVQYFGSYDYGVNWVPENPPTKLQTVYLSGRPGVDTIYKYYFDTEYWGDQGLLYHQITVYLTPSITTISDASIQYYDCFKEFFYYQDSQYEGSQSYISKTNESYVYPASITGFRITSKESEPMINSQNFKVTQDGTVYANAGRIGNVDINNIGVIAQTIKSPNYKVTNTTIDGFQITSEEGQPMINSKDFQVTQEGVIHSTAGKIAGWDIDNEGIYKKVDNNLMVYMSSGSDSYASIANKGEMSPVRFLAGTIKTVEVEEAITSTTQTFTYSPSDCIKILSANYMIINTGGGCNLTGIGTNTLTASWSGVVSAGGTLKITYTYESPNFAVLEDGSLHASAADITGTIHATDGDFTGTIHAENGGKIGNLNIENGGLESSGSFILNEDGLEIGASGAVRAANFTLTKGNEQNIGEVAYLRTTGPLRIEGRNNNSTISRISLMTEGGSTTIDYYYYLKFSWVKETNTILVYLLSTDSAGGNLVTLLQNGHELEITYWLENRYGVIQGDKHTVSTYVRGGANSIALGKNFTYVSSHGSRYINISAKDKITGKVYTVTDYENNFGSVRSEIGFLISDKITQTIPNNNINIYGNLFPEANNEFYLGKSGKSWKDIYVNNGSILSSDKNVKNSIQPLSIQYEQIFDKLEPISYKFNQNDNDRTHIGFGAQDVKQAIEAAGLTTKECAAYCEWLKDDNEIGCGLRYTEFISLNTWQIQKLKARAKQAEETIELQDAYIKKLEERIEKLEQRLL